MKNYPILKYIILLAAMVYIYPFIPFLDSYKFYILVVLAISLISFIFIKKYTLSYLLSISIVAILIASNIEQSKLIYPAKVIPYQKAIISGKIESIAIRDTTIRMIINGSVDAHSLPQISDTKVILKVNRLDKIKTKIRKGDIIETVAKIKPPKPKLIESDFDELRYCRTNEISFYAFTEADNLVVMTEANLMDKTIESIYLSIKSKINYLFDQDIKGIVLALILGDKSEIDNDVRLSFSLTGTAHLLAVSGLHIGIIATIIYVFLGFILNNWVKFAVFSILIVSYIFLTGLQPSAMRAGIMAIALVLSKCFERKIHPLNLLSLVVLIMLLFDNSLFYSPAFQMSVTSIFGILLFYNIFYEKLKLLNIHNNFIFDKILISLAVTFSASIFVSPIVAYYFNVYSIISPIANLIEIPIMTLSMIGAVLSIILSYILEPIALITAKVVNLLISVLWNINYTFSNYNFAALQSNKSFYLAIFISITLVYLFTFVNLRQLIFRFSMTIIVFFVAFNYFNTTYNRLNIIIPTQNYVILIDDTSNKIDPTVFIFDRKVGLRPFRDKYIRYLTDNYQKPNLYYCGNYGIDISDIYKIKDIKVGKMINPNMADSISKLLNLDDNFFKIIKYENN